MPKQLISCPICGAPMIKRVILDGLEIDYCDSHGVWLDGGELERLAASNGVERSRPAPKVGKAVAERFANAAVAGAGFHLGRRLVGGILDAMFARKR